MSITKSKTPTLLHYETSGRGPVVVLLHGYLASSAYWRKTAAELAKTHRVISIDLLGFGRSPKPACNRYDYDSQLRSLEYTIEHAGVLESFKLMGHSMGSLIALRYATAYPKQVSKLLLTNMPVFLSRRQAQDSIYRTNFIYWIGLRAGFHRLIWPLFRTVSILRLLPRRVGENALDRRRYIFQNTAASRLRSLRNVIFAATTEADLQKLSMPTVILSGLHDRVQYLQNLSRLTFNDHVHSSYVAAGHHLPLTHPQLVAEQVRG